MPGGGVARDCEEVCGPLLAGDSLRPCRGGDRPGQCVGLGGTVWTADTERCEEVASRIQTGTIGINGCLTARAAPVRGRESQRPEEKRFGFRLVDHLCVSCPEATR